MPKATVSLKKAASPRAMRGFILDQRPCSSVSVEFDPERDLLCIRQGNDLVTVDGVAVETFKRGMTWVRAEVLNSNS